MGDGIFWGGNMSSLGIVLDGLLFTAGAWIVFEVFCAVKSFGNPHEFARMERILENLGGLHLEVERKR